jgi:dsRNA-specific ribonuclease
MSKHSTNEVHHSSQDNLNQRLMVAFGVGISDSALLQRVTIHPSFDPTPSRNMEQLSVLGARLIAFVAAEEIINDPTLRELPMSGREALSKVVRSSSFIPLGKSLGLHSLIRVGTNQRQIVHQGVVTDSETIMMSMRAVIGAIYTNSGAKSAMASIRATVSEDIATYDILTRPGADTPFNYPCAVINTAEAQEIVDYKFKDSNLLSAALLRKNNDRSLAHAFWRMDFLGQHLIDLVLVRQIMNCSPEISASDIASTSHKLLETVGLLGEKVDARPKGPWLSNRTLANYIDVRSQLRAILGAMYLDGALDRAQRLTSDLFNPLISTE